MRHRAEAEGVHEGVRMLTPPGLKEENTKPLQRRTQQLQRAPPRFCPLHHSIPPALLNYLRVRLGGSSPGKRSSSFLDSSRT